MSRERILDAAESIFAWKGLEATPPRDVARAEAGVERHTEFLIELTARIFPIPGRAR